MKDLLIIEIIEGRKVKRSKQQIYRLLHVKDWLLYNQDSTKFFEKSFGNSVKLTDLFHVKDEFNKDQKKKLN